MLALLLFSMGLKRKARYMRKRRAEEAASAETLNAKYPTVPECPAVLCQRRKKLRQRNPEKLLISRPKWEDDTENATPGLCIKHCWPYTLAMRSGTADESIFKEIYSSGAYSRSLKGRGYHWLDIGSHGDYFALAALMHGAKTIACYEAFLPNYNLGRYNLLGFGVQLHRMVRTKRKFKFFSYANLRCLWTVRSNNILEIYRIMIILTIYEKPCNSIVIPL